MRIGITDHPVKNCCADRQKRLRPSAPAFVYRSSSGASSSSTKLCVGLIVLSSPLLEAQFLQFLIFHVTFLRFFHRLQPHFALPPRTHANCTATSVLATATTTLKNVVVETPHPSPFVLNSQRASLCGQTFSLKIGDNIGNVAVFGRQAEDCASDCQNSIVTFLVWHKCCEGEKGDSWTERSGITTVAHQLQG